MEASEVTQEGIINFILNEIRKGNLDLQDILSSSDISMDESEECPDFDEQPLIRVEIMVDSTVVEESSDRFERFRFELNQVIQSFFDDITEDEMAS